MIDKTTTRQKLRAYMAAHSLKRLPDRRHTALYYKVFLETILPTSVYDCIVLVSTKPIVTSTI